MPDLNLKGEGLEWESSNKPSRPRNRRRIWFGLFFAIILVAAAGGYALFESRRVQQVSEMPTAPAAKLDSSHNSIGAVPILGETSRTAMTLADSVLTDTIASQGSTLPSTSETEKRSDEVQIPLTPSTATRRYTIQLSAWQSEPKANDEVTRLRTHGLDPFIVHTIPDSAGRTWHRIRVGHFGTVAEARKAAEEMVDSLVSGFTIEKDN